MTLGVRIRVLISIAYEIIAAPSPLATYDKNIDALLSQMTKVTIDLIPKDSAKPWDQIEINLVKLTTAIQKYKIGSIFTVASTGAYDLK